MTVNTTKPTNPKDAIGSDKLPLHLWPTTATAMGCIALLNGALKYGRSNFREIGVRSSIYYDAAKRHLDAWMEGEENDPEDGVPHLSAALACIAVIVDAQAAGKLNDDRNVEGGYRRLVSDLTPHVARLKELHKDRSPKHYTKEDNKPKITITPQWTQPLQLQCYRCGQTYSQYSLHLCPTWAQPYTPWSPSSPHWTTSAGGSIPCGVDATAWNGEEGG